MAYSTPQRMRGTSLATLRGIALTAAVLGLVVAGCAEGSGDPSKDPTTSASEPEPTQTAPTDEEPTDGEPTDDGESTGDGEPTDGGDDPRVQSAIEDLADHAEVDPASIGIAELNRVTWPDGSLGCPEPDQMYTQALVDGQQLILTIADREYFYHSALDQDFFLCESPMDPAENETTQ